MVAWEFVPHLRNHYRLPPQFPLRTNIYTYIYIQYYFVNSDQIRLWHDLCTSCSSSSSRSMLGSFLTMIALQERVGELSQDRPEHAELAEDIDKESRWRSSKSLSRPLWLCSPGLNFMSSRQRGSLSSDDVVTWMTYQPFSFTTLHLSGSGARFKFRLNWTCLIIGKKTYLHFDLGFILCGGCASRRRPWDRWRPEEVPRCCVQFRW